MPQRFASDRPSSSSAEVKKAAALAMCARLKITGDKELSEAAQSLIAVFNSSSTFDSARTLDSAGWDVDDETLELLADRDMFLWEARRNAVAAWVEKRRIKAQRQVGDKVVFTQAGEDIEGEVIKVNEKEATYTVFCESQGHVRSGPGPSGLSLEFERFHRLAEPSETFSLEG